MRLLGRLIFTSFILGGVFSSTQAAERVVVTPQEIDDVLVNPGMGFTTFERIPGPDRQEPNRDLYPPTSVSYMRLYWDTVEPVEGEYHWDVIDDALAAAKRRNQTLMLRLSAHSRSRRNKEITRRLHDVPPWYREMVGSDFSSLPIEKWSLDPEDPRYVKYYSRLIRAARARYDGHPDLESVDLAIVGAWGEGAGANKLTVATMHALVDAYIDAFPKTPLVALLMDARTNKYALSRRDVGWRADCLGDLGGFEPNWSHMRDHYPAAIKKNGLTDAWKKAPVSFEVCWVMNRWKKEGWDVDYIIDRSLEWHISTFNAKSSPVPDEWKPAVERWLKHMGYRFVLTRMKYPASVPSGGAFNFNTCWQNKGVAPCYRAYPLAIKLTSANRSEVLLTDADIREWLPGHVGYAGHTRLPALPAGEYTLSLAIVDPETHAPRVKLAIVGVDKDGWYPMGKIAVE